MLLPCPPPAARRAAGSRPLVVPLAFGNVIFRGTFDQLALPNRSPNLWFSTQLFERSSAAQLANNIRTLSSNIAAVRADGMNILDLAVHKRFRIREYLSLELRGEGEGILNHPNLAAPNLNPATLLRGTLIFPSVSLSSTTVSADTDSTLPEKRSPFCISTTSARA